jgi:hypothetical protein
MIDGIHGQVGLDSKFILAFQMSLSSPPEGFCKGTNYAQPLLANWYGNTSAIICLHLLF